MKEEKEKQQHTTITLDEVIYNIKSLTDSIAEQELLLKAYKIKIQDVFDRKNVDVLETKAKQQVTLDGKQKQVILQAKKSERLTINYFADKIKGNVSKKVYNEIVDKTYTIVDMPAMIKLLKEHGVKPKDFKKLLNVEDVVNKKKLQQTYDLGHIQKKDLRGCYEAKISKSVKVVVKGEK